MKITTQEVENLIELSRVNPEEKQEFSKTLLQNLKQKHHNLLSEFSFSTEHFENIGGIVAGSGQPLILLHGVGSIPIAYQKLIKKLSKKFMVIAPALPGHGSTTINQWFETDTTGNLHNFMTFLNEVKQHFKIETQKIVLLGHNLGGNIALQYAKENPALVTKAILINILSGPVNLLSPKNLFKMIRAQWDFVIHNKSIPFAVVKSFFRNFSQIRYSISLLKSITLTGVSSLKVPIEIYWGEKDQILPVSVAKKLHESIKSSTMHIIQNRNHNWIVDSPELLKL